MDIVLKVQASWDLGPVLEVKDLGGSGACFLVITGQGSFVYKQVGRLDFVLIYDRVQRALNASGLAQALVIPARDGRLMQSDGFSLSEYVPGDALLEYTDEQFVSAVTYLCRYNEALRLVPFVPGEIASVNVWDEVRSTEYLCSQADSLAVSAGLDATAQVLLKRVASMLRQSRVRLDRLPKQLIHSDPGPGNVIFDGSEVRTIIDFTPDFENEMYSLAQFLYWTCLWEYDKSRSRKRLETALDLYRARPGISERDHRENLLAYLLKACLYRLMGPALNMLRNGSFRPERVSRRLLSLERLLTAYMPRD